jgi:thiol-disulfide isomerase/thioredoxin
MLTRSRVVAVLLTLLSTTSIAQPQPSATAPSVVGKAPGECTKTLNDWRTEQLAPLLSAYRAATPENQEKAANAYTAAARSLSSEAIRAANVCAARFDVNTIPPAQLGDLIALYAFAGDTAGRRRATERMLSARDLPPRQQAQALALEMNQEISRQNGYFGILESAERIADRIDALPDSLADIKLKAHQTLLGQYEYLDVNEGLRKHATATIELGRRLKMPEAMLNGFSSLARSAADRLQPDSALAILAAAEKELGSSLATRAFADFRNRYALIGTKAAPIEGQWWLNTTGTPSTVMPNDGKVRLIEFTAHWCGPCKNSYPGLRALAERFRGKEFEGVLVTSLYGFIGTQRGLTPEQEVEADRAYYGKEHELPFRVAVNPPPKPQPGKFTQPKADEDYRVGGIPQIIIIDRRGVIRQMVTGWDQGNTKRIGDLIERLLKEPSA